MQEGEVTIEAIGLIFHIKIRGSDIVKSLKIIIKDKSKDNQTVCYVYVIKIYAAFRSTVHLNIKVKVEKYMCVICWYQCRSCERLRHIPELFVCNEEDAVCHVNYLRKNSEKSCPEMYDNWTDRRRLEAKTFHT